MEDFEIQPMNPMQQVCEIIELAHQCVVGHKAFVKVDCFGSCDSICVMIITDFTVEEYPSINSFHLSPPIEAFHKCTPVFVNMRDQIALQSIIDRLKEVLA